MLCFYCITLAYIKLNRPPHHLPVSVHEATAEACASDMEMVIGSFDAFQNQLVVNVDLPEQWSLLNL